MMTRRRTTRPRYGPGRSARGPAALILGGLLLTCSLPAHAVWGPFGGVARLESEDANAGVFDGFEVGVIAFGPEGQGFWQVAFTRLDQDPGGGRLTRAGARLNFALRSGTAGMFYAGPSGGRNWLSNLDPAGDRTLWTYGAQAGLLVAPSGIWSVLRKPSSRPKLGSSGVGVTPGTFLLGAEAGWTQGKSPLQGFEFRAFATLLY